MGADIYDWWSIITTCEKLIGIWTPILRCIGLISVCSRLVTLVLHYWHLLKRKNAA